MNERGEGYGIPEEELISSHAMPFEKPPKQPVPKHIKILLVRHGQAGHNVAPVSYFVGGSTEYDSPLVAEGIDSAKRVAELIRPAHIEAVLCSDLKRARQTAEIIAAQLGYPVDIVEFEGLREVQVGELTGKTREEIRQSDSAEVREALELFLSGDFRQLNFPGGETFESASQRAKETLKQIIAQHGDKASIAIVGHGNINKIMLSIMFPDEIDFIRQLDQGHTGVVTLDAKEDIAGDLQFSNMSLLGEGEGRGLI